MLTWRINSCRGPGRESDKFLESATYELAVVSELATPEQDGSPKRAVRELEGFLEDTALKIHLAFKRAVCRDNLCWNNEVTEIDALRKNLSIYIDQCLKNVKIHVQAA